MPDVIPVWLASLLGGIGLGLIIWFLKRLLKDYDDRIARAKSERREMANNMSAIEREIHQRIDKSEREADREYLKREDLQTLLKPINVALDQILHDQRERAAIPETLRYQGEHIEHGLDEIRALREEWNAFWKQFGPGLAWAKRKSEEV